MVSPEVQYLPARLAAVVDEQAFRRRPFCNDAVERSHDILIAQAMADHKGPWLAAIDIDDGQQSYSISLLFVESHCSLSACHSCF